MTLLDLMSQPEPAVRVPTRQSDADRLQRYFEARPCCWIGLPELGREFSAHSLRQRISDLRARGVTVENQKAKAADGRWHSSYRYIPRADTRPEA